MRFLQLLEGFWAYYAPEGGGGAVDPPATDPPADPATDPPADPPQTFDAAYVKTLRDEAATNRRKAKDLETRLQQVEDANKTEAQRLQERAERLPAIEQERDALKAERDGLTTALGEVVEEQRKRLAALDKEMLDLLPEGSPTAQLTWLARAVAKAEKDAADRKSRGQLPPSGGRNPGDQHGEKPPTKEDQDRAAAHYASRF